ncbi:MAG: glycosyltransferase family 4 protein [Chitinophagales bacterium]|nr:glycosyltransferase family 4 protein [Chitinophagales bacterium]
MTKSKKILFIVPHRVGRSPGQRFRFEQYFDKLEAAGYEITVSNLLSENDDVTFYSRSRYFQKGIIVLKSIWKRYADLLRAGNFDIIFVYREAIMLGSVWFEENLAKSGARLIMDFDDAIWLKDVSEGNKNIAFLKKPEKTFRIVELADLVIVGNKFIADRCSMYNNNIKCIPTTIDTDYHRPYHDGRADQAKICIGWTGTETTLKHFETALPSLERIYEKYSDKIHFKLICDKAIEYPSIGLRSERWNKETEIQDLNEMDIGLMPLPDDEWSRAKCGFKALQYLSLEIPAIVSPVGVNTKIIDDGINGFFAKTSQEWFEKLELLILSHELRVRMGKAGREKVKVEFSKNRWFKRYIELFDSCISTPESCLVG